MDPLTRDLLAARDGDRTALAAVIRAAQPDVWRFCASLVDVDSADDLTQETFVRVMRAAPQFRGESSARTWLFTIARRTCADEIRRRQRRRRIDRARRTAEVAERAAAVAGDVPDEVLLDQAMAHLPVERAEAFLLTQLVGLDYAATAEVLAVPIGTVRSRVARARRDLVAWLADEGGAEG